MGGPSGKEVGQQQQSWANLNNLFSTASANAKQFGDIGQSTLGDLTNYAKSLFTRQGAEAAAAPATGAAVDAATAARKDRAASGTSRTGGTAATNATAQDNLRKEVDSLVAGAPAQGASILSNLGNEEINAMLQSLGLATNATGEAGALIGQDVQQQRQASADMWSSLIGGAAKLGAAAIPSMGTWGSSSSVPYHAGAGDSYTLTPNLPATLDSGVSERNA
jgi:hypothetical protein